MRITPIGSTYPTKLHTRRVATLSFSDLVQEMTKKAAVLDKPAIS